MIVKIVCAGENDFSSLYKKDIDEYIISVDGGIKVVNELGLKADLAIGDFDSCDINLYQNSYLKRLTFEKRKDYSDLELSLMECEKLNPNKVIIYNATGNRLDHFYANLLMLERYFHLDIEMVNKNNHISVINKETHFKKNEYKYISFFALEEEVKISLKGFSYELDNYELSINDTLCLSNEIEKEGIIKVNDKKVLVIRSN